MSRFLTILILLAACVAIPSCESQQKKREKKKQDDAAHFRDTTTNLALIEAEALAADGELVKLVANLTEKPTPNVQMAIARTQSVRGSLGKIIPGVRLAGKEVLTAKTKNDDLGKQVDDLIAEQDKSLLWWTTLGIVGGGIIVVGSLAASIVAKSYEGLPWLSAVGGLSAVGWLLGGISLMLRTYLQSIPQYRPVIGAVSAAAICFGIVLAVYKGWKHGRLKKGFAEVVATGEAVKARPDVPTEAIAEEAAKIQSPATTQLVQNVLASTKPTP